MHLHTAGGMAKLGVVDRQGGNAYCNSDKFGLFVILGLVIGCGVCDNVRYGMLL